MPGEGLTRARARGPGLSTNLAPLEPSLTLPGRANRADFQSASEDETHFAIEQLDKRPHR